MKKVLALLVVLVSFFAFAQDDAMAMVSSHAWGSAALTDARTGETFKIADYAGKTIYVETFATWCPNCQKQLTAIHEAQMKFPEESYFARKISVLPLLAK